MTYKSQSFCPKKSTIYSLNQVQYFMYFLNNGARFCSTLHLQLQQVLFIHFHYGAIFFS